MAERPGVLRIGDRVVFSGAEYSVVALWGSMVRLVAESGETAVVAIAHLAGRLTLPWSGPGLVPAWRRRGCSRRCPRRPPPRRASGSGSWARF